MPTEARKAHSNNDKGVEQKWAWTASIQADSPASVAKLARL
jgi:hypothetical protein